MSKQPIASAPSASSSVDSSPSSSDRPCGASPSAIRDRTACTRATAAARRAPGRMSARCPSSSTSAPSVARASPTSPSDSYVTPIRAGSASRWITAPSNDSAYWLVVSAPSSVPTHSTTSASVISSTNAASSQPQPTASGCESAIAPLPM